MHYLSGTVARYVPGDVVCELVCRWLFCNLRQPVSTLRHLMLVALVSAPVLIKKATENFMKSFMNA